MEIRGLGQHNVRPFGSWLKPALRRSGGRRLAAKDFLSEVKTPQKPPRVNQGGHLAIGRSLPLVKDALDLAKPGENLHSHLRVRDAGGDGKRYQRPLQASG
jgi:hypothetical protein